MAVGTQKKTARIPTAMPAATRAISSIVPLRRPEVVGGLIRSR